MTDEFTRKVGTTNRYDSVTVTVTTYPFRAPRPLCALEIEPGDRMVTLDAEQLEELISALREASENLELRKVMEE